MHAQRIGLRLLERVEGNDGSNRRSLARQAGVTSGSPVAIFLEKPSDMAIWVSALSKNLACIPLPKEISNDQLRDVFLTLKPQAIINDRARNSSDELADRLSIPSLKVIRDPMSDWRWRISGCASSSTQLDWPDPKPDQVALILMTSGSTRSPKLVPVTHKAIGMTVAASAQILCLKPGEQYLNVMPLNHVHGLISGVYLPWIAGGLGEEGIPAHTIAQ